MQNRTDDSQRTLHDWRTPEVDDIMSGYLRTLNRLLASDFDLVVLAAVMSFAFAFIRPLDHGNGRLHRYLLHAILSRLNFKYILSGEFPFALSEMLRKRPTVYDHMLESFARRKMLRELRRKMLCELRKSASV